jgi:signal transduction histidine kinase
MDELRLTFLPFPHVYNGERRDGLTHSWPNRCRRCRDRQCERSESVSRELCSYGYHFQRIDPSLLIAGVVLSDTSEGTQARRKALRDAGRAAISSQDLESVALQGALAAAQLDDSIAQIKHEVRIEYQESEQYKQDLVELLRPSVEQTFAQVHDYRQLISQIVQHVNVLLETRFPGLPLDEQLSKCNRNIRSIYWAARLMEFKLLSALFLANPDAITDPRNKRVFRLHGAIHKYLQIYRPLFDSRGLRFRTAGESHGHLMENPDAVGVIPQAFIDNAIKYAPVDSEVLITFEEDEDSIKISVTSEGPQILREERLRIFDLFFRGTRARASGEEGTGFGLGLARLIAERIDATLDVEQESNRLPSGAHRTTFSASFRKPVEGEGPPAIVNARARRRGGPSVLDLN